MDKETAQKLDAIAVRLRELVEAFDQLKREIEKRRSVPLK